MEIQFLSPTEKDELIHLLINATRNAANFPKELWFTPQVIERARALSAKCEASSWHHDLPTERQMQHLVHRGFDTNIAVTKGMASILITRCINIENIINIYQLMVIEDPNEPISDNFFGKTAHKK